VEEQFLNNKYKSEVKFLGVFANLPKNLTACFI